MRSVQRSTEDKKYLFRTNRREYGYVETSMQSRVVVQEVSSYEKAFKIVAPQKTEKLGGAATGEAV